MMLTPAPPESGLTRTAPTAVVNAIARASAKTGVDFDFLLQQAATESSFDSKAQASTSSARGLYQFVDSTWLDVIDKHGSKHGLGAQAAAISRDPSGKLTVSNPQQLQGILALRDNPDIAALMAAELACDNRQCLEGSLGRKVGNTELYMAHFLGAGGAVRFLSQLDANPASAGASVLPSAARANQSVFFASGQSRSVDEIYNHFADKFSVPDTPPVTIVEKPTTVMPAATIASLHRVMANHVLVSSELAEPAPPTVPRHDASVALSGALQPSFQPAQQNNRLPGAGSIHLAELNLLSLRLLQTLPAHLNNSASEESSERQQEQDKGKQADAMLAAAHATSGIA